MVVMSFFHYKDSQLYCEETPVEDIANQIGTPVYIYSHQALVDRYRELDKAFMELDHLICFSLKSNSNLAVCKTLAKEGAAADIVSGGELFRALKAGFDPEKIVYAGVGKTIGEIEFVLKSGILMFNVESMQEAAVINEVAGMLNCKAKIALRVNPNIDPHTHPHITTGRHENKFGVGIRIALSGLQKVASMPHLDLVGIHCHVGSQITTTQPYIEMLERLLPLVEKSRSFGMNIHTLNIGGGLGITYRDEAPPTADDFAQAVLPHIKASNCRLILEPGRFIAGNAGILVTRVLYVKHGLEKTFIIVDAAMNDFIRPVLYSAYHAIQLVRLKDNEQIIADVVGPVCESGDFFAKDRGLPSVESGDLLAVFDTGAYGFTMSSNYNSRPRAAEVLVMGGECNVVRQRETYGDLIRGESIPEELL